jgi:hypothetical protein
MLEKLRIHWADGTETDVAPLLPDTWAFETALKNNPSWGGLKDNLMKAQQFKAFAALKRTEPGDERAASWAVFGNQVHNISVVDDDAPADELEVPGVGLDTQPDHSTS